MCDTVVVVQDGEVWFAKNSDRDPNEGQALRWFAARDWRPGEVRCGEVAIAQVPHTHAVLLSQPFWLWGAEMGANEHGVVIGNEAVFTDQPLASPGLSGMDLVRLGLERARSAVEACDVIAGLVERHGQGGRGGLEQASFRYSSSFLIADATGAFVLETAGRHTASERVTSGVRAISNALSLPAMTRHADQVRTRVACAADRAARSRALAAPSLAALTALLRDHGGHPWPDYHPLTGTLDHTCMHGGGLLAASQTTASWISRLTPAGASHWATGTSSPCLSLFKPVRVEEPLDLGPLPADRHDRFSLFWQAEELHRRTMRDPVKVAPLWCGERDAIEAAWASEMPAPAEAWALHRASLARWKLAVRERPDGRPWWARTYWKQRERWARRETPDGG